ncbi:Nucleotidyl transferase AbiEii toxin, Type IV TA system [Cyclobacterium lianum]|uniref:Nucleotidyl transferase AbiEii toxin, Type IV TA system n=1 Tax=Cyclobacterium lianum TaxID=388280 RepID=A0A1M7HQZ3_9BACT|nr:nucleotidyl transferase AbiEii/AbiGii toxin family protein [Cyclobacterium lianum]SHM30840.1 Nucleotidyl transferase AbiEii toxin, Type IV TA system [Cyclobacterium lianum]
MKNTLINRLATLKVAKALDDLCEEVVFVGGAMVSLYIDDPYAEDIRPTKDIDVTFQITTAWELERIRILLNQKGFKEAADSPVTCRFKYDDLPVDVMSTQGIGWAPGNQWFSKGFDQAIPVLIDETKIKVLPLPYFLATKFDAFFHRGIKDVYASKDLEDIVYLFNHTSEIVDQIVIATDDAGLYVRESVQRLMNDPIAMGAIPGHLFFENADEQYQEIKQKFNKLAREL